MKKFLAMLMAVMMVLSLVTVPVMAESPAANDPRLSTAPKTGTAAAPADAANLNEALNVAGGTLTFTSEGDHPWIVDGDAAKSTNVRRYRCQARMRAIRLRPAASPGCVPPPDATA